MRIDDIERAEAEAKRFLERIALWRRADEQPAHGYLSGSQYTGNIKRASMDLTRALADIRR